MRDRLEKAMIAMLGMIGMIGMMTRLGGCLLIAVTTATVTAEVPLVPRAILFAGPVRSAVRLSPDGTRVSFVSEDAGVRNIWVMPIDGEPARPFTQSRKYPIDRYEWVPNGTQIVYLHDPSGDRDDHVFVVDVDTGGSRDLTPFSGVRAQLLGTDRDHPDTALIALNDRSPREYDTWRVDTRTGNRDRLFTNERHYDAVVLDHRLDVRAASLRTRSGGIRVHARDRVDEPWYELVHWDVNETPASRVLGLSRDGRVLYVQDARVGDTSRLWAYTLPRGDGPYYDLLAADDDADLVEVIFDPRTGRPQAVAFERERRRWQFLDGAFQADWQLLAGIDAGEPALEDRDAADRHWLVSFGQDTGPRRFHLFDRETRAARYLFADRPALADVPLASMDPLTIEARDGLPLVSYLTLPPGASRTDARRWPMVLLVHDGPWSRCSWGFDPVHQWLANRGYAVLSINYRGSTGFGKRFLEAGNRQWSGRMHDDLIDAVNWAVEAGVADPDRVAVMGSGYGGYATLVGLTMTAPFFAAGVDLMGPAHVRTLLESMPTAAMLATYETRVGKLEQSEFLDLISPLNFAHAIRRPLLIGHGRNDPSVREHESREIVTAMERRGLPVTYVVFPDEGAPLRHHRNALAFHAIVEAFLQRHLGGRAEPIGDAVRASSAEVQAGAPLIPGLVEAGE